MNFGMVTKMGKTAQKLAVDNAPTILTAVGVVGTVATAVLTHKAAVKATHEIAERDSVRKIKGEEPLTRTERIKHTWVNYLPPIASGAITIGVIVYANRISAKRMAALAAGYGLLEGRFDEYKTKMQEKLGIKKESEARDELAQDRTDKNPPDPTLIITEGKTLFRDEPSGRYFESTMENIKRAENDLNRKIIKDEYAVLTDWYEMIGLPATSLSEEFGWEMTNELVDVLKSAVITPEGRPCICLDYNIHPIRNGHGGGGSAKIRAV